MIVGIVAQVSADASDNAGQEINTGNNNLGNSNARLAYKMLITLNSQNLAADGHSYPLTSGMQVSAEIRLGTRSVLDYLLSPIQGAFHEAGRER